MRASVCFVVLLIAAAPVRASGQGTTRDSTRAPTPAITHILKTIEGSAFLGRLVQDTPGSDSVRFATAGAVITISRKSIASLASVSPTDLHDGEYWFPNPNATRLFFAPTGRTLKRGEGYYSNTYLFLNGVNVGATDRISVGGTVTLIPGTTEQVGYLTPKVGVFASENLNISAGALVGYNGVADDDVEHQFGLLYSVVTFGSPDVSSTAGIGYGYVGSKLARSPAIMLGGAVRMSRRTALVTENYFVSAYDGKLTILGYGVRFFGEKLSVDLAFVNSASELLFPGVPFVSFAVKF